MARKKRQGHYCKICREIKANEKFSGKGHIKHICKSCQSKPANKQIDRENTDESFCEDFIVYDYTDIDNLPVFSEKKKFTELDKDEKTLLRDYIRSEIIQRWNLSNLFMNDNELVEMKKGMISLFEEECHIILKNDATLRKFFQDNATSTINRLQKKTEVSPEKNN